ESRPWFLQKGHYQIRSLMSTISGRLNNAAGPFLLGTTTPQGLKWKDYAQRALSWARAAVVVRVSAGCGRPPTGGSVVVPRPPLESRSNNPDQRSSATALRVQWTAQGRVPLLALPTGNSPETGHFLTTTT